MAHSPIVFVGNCQAAALAWVYNKYVVSDPAENAKAFDGRALCDAARSAINAATTVVVQVADLNDDAVRQFNNARARVILFPYVSGNFIWPFATEGHVFGKHMPLVEFGAFSDEMGGDKFLNRMVLAGTDPQQVIDVYMDLDIATIGKLAARYDLSQRMQRARDERSGIAVASYIESTLCREPLFATRGHPFAGLFKHLAVQVFGKLGASARALSLMEQDLQPGPLEHECVPIHPGVASYFRLPPIRPDGEFLFNMILLSYEEYIRRYMQQACDPDLLRGRQLAQHGQHEAAAEALSQGLQHSPRTPEGERLLSHALQQLNRRQEALAAAERSVRIDPHNLQSLLHLAQSYLGAGNVEASIATLGNFLQLHPESRDGHRMLKAALDIQGSRQKLAVG